MLFLILAACSPAKFKENNPNGGSKDLIIPHAAHGILLDSSSTNNNADNNNSISREPRISLETSQIIQDVREENIDADPALEQVITFKAKNDLEDLLHITVADYDENRSIWAPTWQGITRATNIKTFSIRVMDLTGDGLPELVCQGTNRAGDLTLDIFKIIGDKLTFPLQYSSILSVNADISLEVQQPVDSGSLSTGDDAVGSNLPSISQKTVDIIAQSKDLESQSPLDMVQTIYRWHNSREAASGGQYIVESSIHVPGATVQETALDQLYRSSVADFERKYLAGAWTHSYINQRKKNIIQILFFDPEARTIRLIEGDRMEAHQWSASRKPAYGGTIQASLVNENYQSLHSSVNIQAKGLNLLGFSLQDRNDWTGDFTRLSPEMEEQSFSRTSRTIPINRLVLSGLYRSDNGLEIVFSAPHFTWRNAELKQQGGFLSYQLNYTVLEFKFINSRGLVEKERYYIADLVENNQENAKVVRVLTLHPAMLTVAGVTPDTASPDILHLEQRASDIAP